MVAAAKAAVPTVGDQAAALQLGNFAKATAMALSELRAASTKAAEVCGSLEIDSAIATVKELSKEMVGYKQEASKGRTRGCSDMVGWIGVWCHGLVLITVL